MIPLSYGWPPLSSFIDSHPDSEILTCTGSPEWESTSWSRVDRAIYSRVRDAGGGGWVFSEASTEGTKANAIDVLIALDSIE